MGLLQLGSGLMTLWTTSRRFFHLRAALCQNLTKFQFCDLQSPTSELSHISRVSYTLACHPQLSLSRLLSQDLDKTLSYSVSAAGKRGGDPGQSLQAGLCDLRQSTVEWRDVPAGREPQSDISESISDPSIRVEIKLYLSPNGDTDFKSVVVTKPLEK